MGLFDFFRNKDSYHEKKEPQKDTLEVSSSSAQHEEWEEIPAYIDSDEKELVSVIASAIAAADQPESIFRVKSIKIRNPEAKKIAIIASSLASTESNDSTLVVTKILKKKENKTC